MKSEAGPLSGGADTATEHAQQNDTQAQQNDAQAQQNDAQAQQNDDAKSRADSQPKLRSGRSVEKSVGLQMLADYLGLSASTISVVLNNKPNRSIPEATRQRIREAAQKFNYQPSFLARSLRSRQTHTIGILVPELGDGYHTHVMSAIGDQLMQSGYFYFTAHHRHRPELVEEYANMLVSRGVEGIIAIDTALRGRLSVPVVAVAGHQTIAGVTNVLLDHRKAAELSLNHLYDLGHREIAFMRGQSFSSDSESRWASTVEVARELGLVVRPELTVQLERDLTSPELGYPVIEQLLGQQLLGQQRRFTALVSFNDHAAIGAIRALQDRDFKVPDAISVMGFDDIKAASFHNPSLTTIRQPLHDFGAMAADILIERILGNDSGSAELSEVAIAPQLVVRESTGRVSR